LNAKKTGSVPGFQPDGMLIIDLASIQKNTHKICVTARRRDILSNLSPLMIDMSLIKTEIVNDLAYSNYLERAA